MATEVIWSDAARQDLDDIEDYIAQDSPRAAQGVVTKLFGSTRPLADFPRMGRVVPELDDRAVRELIVFRYRVIYRISADVVSVRAVVHGARRLKNAIPGRDI